MLLKDLFCLKLMWISHLASISLVDIDVCFSASLVCHPYSRHESSVGRSSEDVAQRFAVDYSIVLKIVVD